MARGLFVTGFTVSEVLGIQQKAKELLLEGKTLNHTGCSSKTEGEQLKRR